MKSLRFLVVAVFAVVTISFANAQEPVCSPFEDSYHPHTDCTKYYVCASGQLNLLSCPGNTYWNTAINECDFEFNVPECVGGTRPPVGTTPPATTTTTPTTTTPTTTTPTTTPTTTVTTTNSTTPATTTTGQPTTTPFVTTTPLPNGCPPVGVDKIPYPGSCVMFFICLDGTPFLTNCTDGLYFNPLTKECDNPENVNCTEIPTTTMKTTTSSPTQTTSVTTPSTPAPPTTTTSPTQTPTGTTPSTQTPPTTTSSGTTEGVDFPCPDVPFIYMSHPRDCSKFYSCENGEFQQIYSCGETYWFRFDIQSCVFGECEA